MARLPTLAEPNWQPVLDEFLLVGHNTDGTAKGDLGMALAANASAGATSLVVDRSVAPVGIWNGHLVIDPYTLQCEIRRVTGIAGTTLTLNGALQWAHSAGDRVFFLGEGSVSLAWFGAKGDGSTDDEPAIQAALDETTSNAANLWIEGQNKTYLVNMPIVGGRSAKLRHGKQKAKGTYAPADSTNAMIVGCQGNIRTFTAVAATDVITAVAHGIPSDSSGVIFKGSSLPAGIVAGRFYYVRDRTTDTFKICATVGGTAINLTSDGSGTVYCESVNLCKMWITDWFVDGSDVAGITGIALSLQQPSELNKVRVDNCEVGYSSSGQQATHYNFETINCVKGLVLGREAQASFMWFYGFNAEQCDRGIYIDAFGAENCAFYGIHFEMNDGSGHSAATSVAVDVQNSVNHLTLDNVSVSMQASGQTFMYVATGISASYQLRNVRWASGMSSTGQSFLNDVGRGHNLDQWDDFRSKIASLDAPAKPSSYLYTDPNPMVILGYNGRRTSMGSTIDTEPSMHTRPGTSQTGDQFRAEDSSGNRVSAFNKAGVFTTERNSAPADGDLVAGELAFWFDDTNGAAALKLKGKQADGTVKTGTVAVIT